MAEMLQRHARYRDRYFHDRKRMTNTIMVHLNYAHEHTACERASYVVRMRG